jgi:hypothetical protein
MQLGGNLAAGITALARQKPENCWRAVQCPHRVMAGLDGVDCRLTTSVCQSWVVDNTNRREPSKKEVTTMRLDLAKKVFQVHG